MATFGQFYEMGPYFSGGNMAAGLKIYHYTAGTNTLLNVYTGRDKATAAAQPVVCDSQGIASFYGDGIYKLVVATAANTADPPNDVLYTFDNVNLTDGSLSLVGKGANISSASTLILGTDGDEFVVTGAVTINLISGTQSTVKLVFASTPTLTYSGNILLAHGVSLTVAANDVLTFANEGLSGGNYIWREISRISYSSYALPAAGSAGTVLMSRTASSNGIAYVAALGKAIYGLTYDNGTDATNDLNINIGGCMDATGAYWMTLATALGKQSDVAWAVGGTTGTPAGGLDLIGSAGNNDFYIWLIARSDTGVVDALYSLSSTAPTMPASYDFKRLIGWFKRVGGTIVLFKTYETEGGGLEFSWNTPTKDVDQSNALTTSRRTDALKVPLNFSVKATCLIQLLDASASQQAIIYCPDVDDLTPGATGLANYESLTTTPQPRQLTVRTSATGTIAARSTLATVDSYTVYTLNFTWARRN